MAWWFKYLYGVNIIYHRQVNPPGLEEVYRLLLGLLAKCTNVCCSIVCGSYVRSASRQSVCSNVGMRIVPSSEQKQMMANCDDDDDDDALSLNVPTV